MTCFVQNSFRLLRSSWKGFCHVFKDAFAMNEQLPSMILIWYSLTERLVSFPVFVLRKSSFITLHFTMIFSFWVALNFFFHLISVYACLELLITSRGNLQRSSDFGRFYCTVVMKTSWLGSQSHRTDPGNALRPVLGEVCTGLYSS